MYVCELTKRRYRGKKPREIRGPDDVVALVGPKLRRERRENFVVLVSDHFNRAVRLRSGVERFHVHQCRHTFACRWLERGGSLAALQEILGHSTIVTAQRYARISDDLVKAEADRTNARTAP